MFSQRNAKNEGGTAKRKQSGKIIANILFFSLAASVIFSLVRVILAPAVAPEGVEIKVKSDYTLMLIQCVMGLAVMLVPSFISHKWNVQIPNFIYILYYIFLYCAVFLGEVFEFYYVIPHWDTILHAFSGAMLGALGFILVTMLNDAEKVKVSLSPIFVCLFAFCFALAAGAVWEIYEYSFDGLLGLNMQKFALENGEQLVGRAALRDTMKDIIVDALAALGVAVVGYFSISRKKNA